MFTTGDSFLDGPQMQAAKAPLIGGGAAQLGIILTKKFMPSMSKYAGLIGAAVGSGVVFALKGRLGDDGVGAGIASALVVGLPRQINDLMGGTLMGDDLGAYTMEGLGAYTMEGPAGMEMLSEAPLEIQGLGALTESPENALQIQGSDFGATGFGA